MKFSVICFMVAFALGLISMGLMGQLLYYPVSPVLNLKFPPLSSWSGDWVWPAMIWVGILWSLGFLIAGWIHIYLSKMDWSKVLLYAIYIGILLIWDLALWAFMLSQTLKK